MSDAWATLKRFTQARIGLGLRIVLAVRDGDATFVCVGTHEEIRRYLRSL